MARRMFRQSIPRLAPFRDSKLAHARQISWEEGLEVPVDLTVCMA